MSKATWISVLDQMPEPGKRVLATNGVFVGEAWIGERNKWTRPTGFLWTELQRSPVTHWQPMPDAPKESDRC